MRNYTNPEMKIAKFYIESIKTSEALPTIDPYLSVPDPSVTVKNVISSAQQSVTANVNFQDAISFR